MGEGAQESCSCSNLAHYDPEIYRAVASERKRQNLRLEMIASENLASPAVMEAQGSVLTNKYAEGYPGARYYGGCQYVDVIERKAVTRACKLFGSEHANVQPHAGAPANLAVYFSVLKPGDKIMGMELSHGGHLTHGSPVNISGKYFRVSTYGVSPRDGRIDMEEVRRKAIKEKPRLIIAGASSYPRIIDFKEFGEIAREVGAYLMADIAHIAGLVAAGLHPSPVPHASFITSTTHKTLRGPRGGLILCRSDYASDLDKAVFPGLQGGPLMHVIAAKAVAFKEAMEPSFGEYQKRIKENAAVLAEELQGYGFDLSTGGTDNHMVLVDLQNRNLSGQEAEELLEHVGITVNKNTVPFDPRGPRVTSGIRLGTPTITTRGMGPAEMRRIAGMIKRALESAGGESILEGLRKEVSELCQEFPIHGPA